MNVLGTTTNHKPAKVWPVGDGAWQASNESVIAGLKRVAEDDDIALESLDFAGAVLIYSMDRVAGGAPGRASDVLRAVVKWADDNRETLVLMPAASGALEQVDLVAWYARNGFAKSDGGAMVRKLAAPMEVSRALLTKLGECS